MHCPNPIAHVVMNGDTLYLLAQQYHTTVREILRQNPRLNPYNLQIGVSISICPGSEYAGEGTGTESVCSKKMELINDMRLAWSQHVYWTRMLLLSIAERLADEADVASRLLENPYDIAGIFARYYPTEAAKEIAALLTEHLQIGAKLITALRDKEMQVAGELNRQWYDNARRMSMAFAALNPNYQYEMLQQMFDTHLELTTREVDMRLAKNYAADIKAFDEVEAEALRMADYFSRGLMLISP